MAVVTGNFAKKADGTGLQTISGVGFTPVAVIFFSAGGTSAGSWRAGYDQCLGFTSGPGESYFIASSSTAAVSTTQESGGMSAGCIGFVDADLSTFTAKATLDSFTSDGFVLNWGTNDAVARQIHYMAIGGQGARAKVISWVTPTSISTKAITGVGFQPKGVFHIMATPTTLPSAFATSHVYFGASDPSTQWTLASYSRDARTSAGFNAQTIKSNNVLLTSTTSGTYTAETSHLSLDGDGFTVNYTRSNSTAQQVATLCIGGTGVNVKVGFVGKSTSTSVPVAQAVTGVGFQPQALFFAGNVNTIAGSGTTLGSGLTMFRGASDGTNHSGTFFDTASAVYPVDSNSLDTSTDDVIMASNFDQVPRSVGKVTSLDADGFTLTWSVNNATALAHTVAYIAISTPAPPVVVLPEGGGQSVPATAVTGNVQGTSSSSSGGKTGAAGTSRSSGGGKSAAMKIPTLDTTSPADSADGTAGYVQWRAYLGPPWRPETATDFYDWSALTLTAYTPAADTTVATTIGPAATSVILTDASGFPDQGGIWLGPNAAGESWGYATYTGKSTNTLTGLTRDAVDAEYDGNHTAGAIARFWWPLDTATADPVFNESMDAKWVTVAWDAQIGGISAPVPALRPGMMLLYQERELDGSDWDDWITTYIGWTISHTMRDDATHLRDWTLLAAGSNGVLNTIEIPGIQVGPVNLATKANISVSSTLSPTYKEANTGEFIGSAIQITPQSMADNSIETPWISGRFIGENNVVPDSTETQAAANDGLREKRGVTQFHISKYPGQSEGYRWIELTIFFDISVEDWLIAGIDYFVHVGTDGSAGDHIIFAENPALFSAENPENQASTIVDLADYELWTINNQKYAVSNDATGGTFTLTVDGQTTSGIAYNATAATIQTAILALSTVDTDEVRVTGSPQAVTVTFINGLGQEFGPTMTGDGTSLSGGTLTVTSTQASQFPSGTGLRGPSLFDHLDPAGGILRLYNGPTGQGQSQVVWGTGEPMTTWNPVWTGSPIAAHTAGQTARMLYFPATTTSSDQYWEVGKVATPGYNILTASKEWIHYDLPTMGLTLAADIDDTVTDIAIVKQEEPNVDGLPATGTIQIGLEQISYTAINRTTGIISGGARAQNGTLNVAHTLGDVVYYVEAGVATEAYPVDTITLSRPTGFTVPENFVMRVSALSSARTPDDTNYLVDYTTAATETGSTTEVYTVDLSGTAPRIRFLLVEISLMSGTTPSRVKVNELAVLADDAVCNPTHFLPTGTTATTIIALLQAAGIPLSAITDVGGTGTVINYITQSGLTWTIVTDFADFTSTRVTIGRDSKFTIEPDPFWSIAGTPAEAAEFTRTELAFIEVNKTPARDVGQIELVWRTTTSEAENTTTFPTSYVFGRKTRLGTYVYADETAALTGATKRYYQARRPYDIVAETATQNNTIRPGSIHGLAWKLHPERLTQDRTYLVTAAAHTIRNFGFNTVLTLLQLTRTDEL